MATAMMLTLFCKQSKQLRTTLNNIISKVLLSVDAELEVNLLRHQRLTLANYWTAAVHSDNNVSENHRLISHWHDE